MRTKKGDTIVEVALSLAIFGFIAVVTLNSMSESLNLVQNTLELEMARNEIDAQAEAIRFIHNSYLSERELVKTQQEYRDLWLALSRDVNGAAAGSGLANNPLTISAFPDPKLTCDNYYDKFKINDKSNNGDVHSLFDDNAFIINTRNINPKNPAVTIVKASGSGSSPQKFTQTQLYPRIIYTTNGNNSANSSEEMSEAAEYETVNYAEGIWVIASRDVGRVTGITEYTGADTISKITPEFFDFNVRTCWFGSGADSPTTISTVIRLYNPEYIEGTR
ncbi:MAG: hypothetical protein Q4E47_02095 [Candidatus Saccharibacteria bacterium]|nr:hypothetical protein [Candidatus Saccharibacteria bacterium]